MLEKPRHLKHVLSKKRHKMKSKHHIDGEIERPTIDPKYTDIESSFERPSIEKSSSNSVLVMTPDIKKSDTGIETPEPDIKANRKPQSELIG
jgi:uncharacterized protein YfaP (DUF2135 family)